MNARDFLVRDHDEEPGYGLYSYMLFGRRPTYATRERYLALIREYLSLEEVSNFKKVSRKRLNITYMPLTEGLSSPDSEEVLAKYDFARAADLLSHVPEGPYVDGPYIVSWQGPLTRGKSMSRMFSKV